MSRDIVTTFSIAVTCLLVVSQTKDIGSFQRKKREAVGSGGKWESSGHMGVTCFLWIRIFKMYAVWSLGLSSLLTLEREISPKNRVSIQFRILSNSCCLSWLKKLQVMWGQGLDFPFLGEMLFTEKNSSGYRKIFQGVLMDGWLQPVYLLPLWVADVSRRTQHESGVKDAFPSLSLPLHVITIFVCHLNTNKQITKSSPTFPWSPKLHLDRRN